MPIRVYQALIAFLFIIAYFVYMVFENGWLWTVVTFGVSTVIALAIVLGPMWWAARKKRKAEEQSWRE